MLNCEGLCFIGYALIGIAVISAVFFLCFFQLKKKKLYQQMEQEYGKIPDRLFK